MRGDLKNAVGGGLVMALGLYALVSAPEFGIGTPTNMGAGFFPMALGICGLVSGAVIAVPALFRARTVPQFQWRPLAAVAAAILAFGLVSSAFGYVPGVAAATLLAALGDRRNGPGSIALLTVAIPAAIWLVFHLGLQISPPAFKGF